MTLLENIASGVQNGKARDVKALVQQAIDEGLSVYEILEDGLMPGMDVVGERFKNNEIYLPDVMIAARAMKAGSELLKPLLASSGARSKGKVVIGTVKGDMHDIGKNLVKMMMEGKGLEVIDLGTDVPAQRFIDTAKAEGAQVIALSALLTTTMKEMKTVVDLVKSEGLSGNVSVMIGGAPVTEQYRVSIGADIYTPDAASAADAALKLCESIA